MYSFNFKLPNSDVFDYFFDIQKRIFKIQKKFKVVTSVQYSEAIYGYVLLDIIINFTNYFYISN